MNKNKNFLNWFLRLTSYVLVAAVALGFGFAYGQSRLVGSTNGGYPKLDELSQLIHERFIGEVDDVAMEDGAAAGMVAGLGDQWSYYIPASEYGAYIEQMENAYIGIGVTISGELVDNGFEVLQVEPTGGAREAGILPGDILIAVEGQSVAENGMDKSKELIRGKEGTIVNVTITRDGAEMSFDITRKLIKMVVASGLMLEGDIGLVTINNFDERCSEETIAAVDKLVAEGAKALIFDVRFNPGGYKTELVKILDYLLPEGVLFRSVYYTGAEEVLESDSKCLDLPMAVLVNGSSYSAAEFFAAALNEYDWAVIVGEHTIGKSYFQTTFELSDGSAVGLSVGKYCTPNGVSLAEVGGLEPEITVQVDQDTAAKIYSDLLDPAEDPQIQAAVAAVQEEMAG